MRRLRPTVAQVDLEAIRHNVRALATPGAELMAVVKANAYGHGDVEVSRAALQAGATWLGVALVEEGIALRGAGIEAPILVLSEFPSGSEKEALEASLTPSLYTEKGLAGLVRAARGVGRPAGVHVKVDTGMHRVGLHPPAAALAFVRRVVAAGLHFQGLWSHLARADEDEPTTKEQLRLFLDVADALRADGFVPRYRHIANSAGAMLHPDAPLALPRVGLGIYGLEPAPGLAEPVRIRPALTLRSAVSLVKRLGAGEALSYGHRYRLARETTIATVPIGYADGYTRRLSSHAEVLIRGRRCRVAGAVTMDQLLVDCGDERVEVGDDVVLIGKQGEETVSAEELAALSGTINYEVVAAIGARVPREHLA